MSQGRIHPQRQESGEGIKEMCLNLFGISCKYNPAHTRALYSVIHLNFIFLQKLESGA